MFFLLLFSQFQSTKFIFHYCRISPIIAVVDWKLGASESQSLSARKGKFIFFEMVCSKVPVVSRKTDNYGIPAINTWLLGRHLALLDKRIKDRINQKG